LRGQENGILSAAILGMTIQPVHAFRPADRRERDQGLMTIWRTAPLVLSVHLRVPPIMWTQAEGSRIGENWPNRNFRTLAIILSDPSFRCGFVIPPALVEQSLRGHFAE
jgi:hypothetical protein